jgi:hypothetical protein
MVMVSIVHGWAFSPWLNELITALCCKEAITSVIAARALGNGLASGRFTLVGHRSTAYAG